MTPEQIQQVVTIAAQLAIFFEGIYLKPYLCPRGIPTIGVGATFYEDGRPVTLLDPPITRERAMQLLHWQLRRHFLPKVMRLCPGADTPQRLAALLDFAFNLGTGNLAASTLRRKVNAGEWSEVPGQFMRWVMAAGKVLAGLVKRRDEEAKLVFWL